MRAFIRGGRSGLQAESQRQISARINHPATGDKIDPWLNFEHVRQPIHFPEKRLDRGRSIGGDIRHDSTLLVVKKLTESFLSIHIPDVDTPPVNLQLADQPYPSTTPGLPLSVTHVATWLTAESGCCISSTT